VRYEDDIRRTRLFDLAEHERVHVRCRCGASVVFHPAAFPKKHRTPSDTLLYDLQFRLRCKHYNRNHGFEIAIGSTGMTGSTSHSPPERIVVPLGPNPETKPPAPHLKIVPQDPEKDF
jgi:hypothetical protein